MTKLLNTYEQADFERLAAFYPVKQIGEHAWLIEKAGIVIHKCQRNPFTGNRIFALSCGDNQFGQDFTLYEALRTVDRLLRGQSFIKQADL